MIQDKVPLKSFKIFALLDYINKCRCKYMCHLKKIQDFLFII